MHVHVHVHVYIALFISEPNRKLIKTQVGTQKCHQKFRLHNDCGSTSKGRSVGVTTAIQLLWLNR